MQNLKLVDSYYTTELEVYLLLLKNGLWMK